MLYTVCVQHCFYGVHGHAGLGGLLEDLASTM
jgi:hypothetical protein